MSNDLQALYDIKEFGEISAAECVNLNKTLSAIKVGDIPIDLLDDVKKYLIASLNMGSVEPTLIKDLDKLLELLQ